MNGLSYEIIKAFIKFAKMQLFFSFNFYDKYPKHPSIPSCVWPITRKPNLTSANTSFYVNNNKNANKCQFLSSFTQLSIWSNKFFDRGFTPIIWYGVHNSHTQCNFSCKKSTKYQLCRGCSNNNFNSENYKYFQCS